MDVVVAGGHGQIGLRLLEQLSVRGERVRGLIRNPDHAPDLEARGAEPVVADMEAEDDLAPFVEGADAVDLGAALKLIDAAKRLGIDRYVMVSAIGASDPESASPEMRPYYDAKAEADTELAGSGLAFTIVRPGRLTNDPGKGRIRAGHDIGTGSVTREDVAATLAASLAAPNTIGVTFDLLEGDVPIQDAIAAL